jgi:hypothetical protein
MKVHALVGNVFRKKGDVFDLEERAARRLLEADHAEFVVNFRELAEASADPAGLENAGAPRARRNAAARS